MRQTKYALRCVCGAEFIAEETESFAVFPPRIERKMEEWDRDHVFCRIDARRIRQLEIKRLEAGNYK